MLFTIANLLASGIADKNGALACLFIGEDGTTFATDRKALIVVEPCGVSADGFKASGVTPCDVKEGGVAVPVDTVKEVVKDLPKQPLREIHKTAALTKCEATIQFATTADGVAVKKNSVVRARTALPDIKGFLRSAGSTDGPQARVCVSLKRLKKIIDTLDKQCGGDDRQPIYIELGSEDSPVRLRTQSYLTGQRLLAVLTSVEVDAEAWLKPNKWERRLLDKGAKVKQATGKKKAKRAGKKRVSRRRHYDVDLG